MKSLKILFVEDDLIEVMKFHRVLEKLQSDHQVIEASNAEFALNILRDQQYKPDIIILDLNMPKINGIEFLNILKKDALFKYIPIIILTTSANQRDVKECFEIGIAGYLLKPLKYDDYVLIIKGLLDYWSQNILISI
ncbi:response regulator [Flavobacterium sp. CYK-55]|uniref:response regulator n=1 Tax=Flavobacterium sp. CYK-55 TaxID=2835529 RepID=UPI001BCCF053|nr:response regulator [Flavobacterium sp. CYK-55]MBS7787185.1 response regulator [Flavobacterium sp. CYK-55]